MLNKYNIVKEIGKGNMGKVYLAMDTQLNKYFAIKTAEGNDIVFLRRECELLKNLSDRRIPYIIDYFEDDIRAYLVMEYFMGQNFADYLYNRVPLQIYEALDYIKQIVDIARYLHESRPSVIYRDFKPDNFIIDSQGRIKLIDFGAAVSAFGHTDSKLSVGTYGYCAPEQTKGSIITPSADVYAIGAMFYYMVTGINPEKAPYIIERCQDVSLTCPAQLCEIIDKCCDNNPDNRYSSAIFLQEALNSYNEKNVDNTAKALYIAYYILLSFITFLVLYMIYLLKCNYINQKDIYNIILLPILSWIIRFVLDKRYIRNLFIIKRYEGFLFTEKKQI